MKLTTIYLILGLAALVSSQPPPEGPFNISSPGPRGAGLQLLGHSAKFRVHLNSSDTKNFVQVAFGKVEELDASDKPVQGHRIVALASLEAGLEEGTATSEGTNVSYVQMTIHLNETGPQFKPCSGKSSDDLTGKIIITCYITSSNTSFPFGYNNSIVVGANSLKFNIEAVKWPFCNTKNKLSVHVFLTTNGQDLPKAKVDKPDRPDGTRPDLKAVKGTRARLEFAPGKVAAAVFPAYATDGPDGNNTMDISVAPLGATEGKTGFSFIFPAAEYIYYDPVISSDSSTPAELGLTASPSPTPSPSPAPKKSAGSKTTCSGLLIAAGAILLALVVC